MILCSECKKTLESVTGDYGELNHPKRFAPIDCPIVILVDGEMVEASRTRPIDENGIMEYKLAGGELIAGAYHWSYP